MTVVANSGKEIRIVGGDVTALSFTSGTATDANDCDFYFIDSDLSTSVSTNVSGLDFNMMYCDLPNIYAQFRYGSIIGSNLQYFNLNSGVNTIQNDTTKIIANKFTSSCTISNSDHNYTLANNFFYSSSLLLYVYCNKLTNSGSNDIVNNTFIRTSSYTAYGNNIQFNSNNHSNTNVFNNYFYTNYNSSNNYYVSHIGPSSLSSANRPQVRYNIFTHQSNSYYTYGGVYWDQNLNSTSYNNYEVQYSSNPYNSTNGKVTSGTGINGGNTDVKYYDINMSINDIGTYGGPLSWDNYWNTANGRARVYNLDMPFEIWMGQTPTIKADAVHEK
jgi:hypothetical protein